MARKRTIEQLQSYIEALLVHPEMTEFRLIDSPTRPAFYVLTNRRLIATHASESGRVGVTSIPYTQIGAISVADSGPKRRLLEQLVTDEIEIFGSFGYLTIKHPDSDALAEMYRRLLDKLMHRRTAP